MECTDGNTHKIRWVSVSLTLSTINAEQTNFTWCGETVIIVGDAKDAINSVQCKKCKDKERAHLTAEIMRER